MRTHPLKIFFGLAVNEHVAEFLRSLLRSAYPRIDKSVRWTQQGHLHLTLRFIGYYPEEKLLPLLEAAENKVLLRKSFHLPIHSILRFPHPDSRIIAAIVPLTKPLATLYQQIELAVTSQGIPSEVRPLRPHISLCHSHRGDHRRIDSIVVPDNPWEVTEFILYHSEPTPQGSLYIPVQRFALSNSR